MTDPMLPFTALGDATDTSEFGGKATGLARALSLGHRVPRAEVLGVSAARPSATALARVLERLGGSVAVRSSGVDEDGSEASFSGQFVSVLGVRSAEQLASAIERCTASATAAAVTSYGDRFHRSDTGMAIIVQQMLDPSAAGAAFSIDPVTGRDHVVIEAVAGLGDRLLDGSDDGERWVVADTVEHSSPARVLDAATAREIASVCRRLSDEFGTPVDMEWAIAGDELHLLQVRPITAVPIEPTERPPEGQTFVREPRFDRPLHPLSFTAWLPLHGRIAGEVFARAGLPVDRLDNRHLLGRVYGRMVPVMDRGKDGPAPPAPVFRLLLGVVPAMRRRLRAASAWDGEAPIDRLIESWESEGRAQAAARTAELRSRDLAVMSDADLGSHLVEVRVHLEDVARRHFELAVAAQLIPSGRLGIFLEQTLGWRPEQVIGLLGGHSAASTAHGRAVQALADALGPDGVARAIDDPAWLVDRPEAAEYLERHGHRVTGDLTEPTEAEAPARIADHLRRHRERPGRVADPRAIAQELERDARAALSDADRAHFDGLLSLARRAWPYNDETELSTLDALTLMRPIALECGRRFARSGRLATDRDVFFLELDELRAMLGDPTMAAPDLSVRRGEHRWALANPAPPHLGPEPAPPPSWRVVPSRYRSTVGAILWAAAAAEGPPTAVDAADGVLAGTPVSPGIATGSVRIVRSTTEFDRIQPGDVVVCPTTVAAWSPIFGSISALVTEHGGPLSHPATLAREYGLPAVLAVPHATRILHDGQRVTVDGGAGTVSPIGPD